MLAIPGLALVAIWAIIVAGIASPRLQGESRVTCLWVQAFGGAAGAGVCAAVDAWATTSIFALSIGVSLLALRRLDQI